MQRYSPTKLYNFFIIFFSIFEGESYLGRAYVRIKYSPSTESEVERIDIRGCERTSNAIILVGILFVRHFPWGHSLPLSLQRKRSLTSARKQFVDFLSSIFVDLFRVALCVPLKISKCMDYAAECRSVLIFASFSAAAFGQRSKR